MSVVSLCLWWYWFYHTNMKFDCTFLHQWMCVTIALLGKSYFISSFQAFVLILQATLGWEAMGTRLRRNHTELATHVRLLYIPFQMECMSSFWIQEMSPRLSDVECSDILQSVFVICSALGYLLFFRECATPPHVQVRHTTWLSCTRPSPALASSGGQRGRQKLLQPSQHRHQR